jgi:hypothetical protein
MDGQRDRATCWAALFYNIIFKSQRYHCIHFTKPRICTLVKVQSESHRKRDKYEYYAITAFELIF